MKTIVSLEELNLPHKLFIFLSKYLNNIANIDTIEKVILFGSCAKGNAHNDSDIDLMIIGDNITENDEDGIFVDCIPFVPQSEYVETDIFTSTNEKYNRHKAQVGFIQPNIERDGIDISQCVKRRKDVVK